MPLLGVPKDAPRSAFVMISEWMPNGRITSYVKGRLDVNSFKLVRFRAKPVWPTRH